MPYRWLRGESFLIKKGSAEALVQRDRHPPFISPKWRWQPAIRTCAGWFSCEWSLLVLVDRLCCCPPLGPGRRGEVNLISFLFLFLVCLVFLQGFRVSKIEGMFGLRSRFRHRNRKLHHLKSASKFSFHILMAWFEMLGCCEVLPFPRERDLKTL